MEDLSGYIYPVAALDEDRYVAPVDPIDHRVPSSRLTKSHDAALADHGAWLLTARCAGIESRGKSTVRERRTKTIQSRE